ncbi:MAG TPA: DUF58 domain-containing protein [Pirellulales bacterium]|nr:DUF58 domain-containing protein [Pirellulales bacterium]
MRRSHQNIAITLEGWLYLGVSCFILAGALTRQINLLMLLFGMLAGPLVISWRLVKSTLRKVEIRRKLPQSVCAGDLLIVELAVVNRRWRLGSWSVRVEDSLRRQADAVKEAPILARVLIPYLKPGEPYTASYRGRLPRRGRYAFGPLRLYTQFPLGLLRYRMTIDQPESLVVYPRLGRLAPGWSRVQRSSDLGLGVAARQQGFVEGEFYGLRDWRSGDSRRWLHWRTSARRQTPVVRQFEQQRNEDLAIVLELWQPERPEAKDLETVELAVSFAGTILADLCRRGGKWLSISTSGPEPWMESGPTSTALLHQTMRHLAETEAGPDDHLPEALAALLDQVHPGTRVIVIGTRAVDLSDTARFSCLWNDQRRRAWLNRIETFDAGGEELAEYFTAE